ncbi:hypothetical protein BKA67DRAFT_690823 [Truncatella angustata]|uniref:Uncharacterized protein n=1 Tax=Truncatella angustata TaxID=152316 RepID=A0A9P8UQ32_9PEZI|nr:uncharacterized protein BKA67DRAFT_690823 [Truncatella angustata]KAH6656157.1 hypothetical protein BKA67DRAFT_690823 [Truncatella angustata]
MFQNMPLGSVEPLPPPFTSFAQFKEALDEYYKNGAMGANNPRMKRPGYRSHIATERINAHDGTPCVVAWHQYSRGFPDQPEERFGTRRVPFGSFQVYLPCHTTDSSRDVEIHRDETTSRVAELLESKTHIKRHSNEVPFRDRLDVFGLAVRPGSSREELVSACIAHQQSEIAARNQASGVQEGGIEDEEKWAGDKTTFLFVWFDRKERKRDEEDELDYPPIKVLVKQGLQQAAKEMHRMRGAGSGIIENTLEKYSADFGEPYVRPEPLVKRPTRSELIRRRKRREQGLPSDDEDEDVDDDN